ncbi:MAG: hypothetical protein EOQ89_26290 [Mesorhizobium sp.]|nr:MAG: hypothetical protein EOQ89_26290 [Mesorhizobium sp.]
MVDDVGLASANNDRFLMVAGEEFHLFARYCFGRSEKVSPTIKHSHRHPFGLIAAMSRLAISDSTRRYGIAVANGASSYFCSLFLFPGELGYDTRSRSRSGMITDLRGANIEVCNYQRCCAADRSFDQSAS